MGSGHTMRSVRALHDEYCHRLICTLWIPVLLLACTWSASALGQDTAVILEIESEDASAFARNLTRQLRRSVEQSTRPAARQCLVQSG